MDGGIVEVIGSKGCSRLFMRCSSQSISSINSMKSSDLMSPSSSALSGLLSPSRVGPFSGLVICVTGLSKEARLQVMAATERLGGHYSSSLHPKCTHLVVQSCVGRKIEHALKHGQRNGLFVVTLGWFVDSARRNVRLNESLYSVKSVMGNGLPLGDSNRLLGLPGTEKSCIPRTYNGEDISSGGINTTLKIHRQPICKDSGNGSIFSNDLIYIDADISEDLRKKVVDAATREGATFLDHWFIGSPASHIICESTSIQRYIGQANGLVTPFWILKTVKEKCMQRLVHFSSDLVRHVAMMLENNQTSQNEQDTNDGSLCSRNSHVHGKVKYTVEERQKNTELAKMGVRSRRAHRMQSCQMPLHPIAPSSLLEAVCWSVSEPTSLACIYAESSEMEDATSVLYDARGDGRDTEGLMESFTRPLTESEKSGVIFKYHFLTVLFPIDRYGELGPSSRTFFNDGGFTCLEILDCIYNFYQENMSAEEIEVAIHTDSRHADRLRSIYATKQSLDQGHVQFRRVDFLGSRRSFESLKKISGQNNGSCYELLLRA